MRHVLASLALLTACTTAPQEVGTAAAPPPPLPSVSAPTLDTRLTGGLSQADHVEVAPGVHLVRSLFEAGEVAWVDVPADVAASRAADVISGTAPPPPFPDPDGGSGSGEEGDGYVPSAETCLESASDNYMDSTRTGETFGGNASWYGTVTALSYSDTSAGRESRSNYVSTYAYTSFPRVVDHVSAYGYVYIDGRYIGYMQDYQTDASYATAFGTFWTPCAGRASVTVDMQTYHYLYDVDGWSLNVGSTVSATVTCCP